MPDLKDPEKILDELESNLRSVGYKGTQKVLRLVKKLRKILSSDEGSRE
tara:strand:+ start:230 stop:376 length:147 start_codon:yes stop_codon:yes gene_type:complete